MTTVTVGTVMPSDDLARLEIIIEDGLARFVEVGRALRAIQVGSLYEQAGYESFGKYIEGRWNLSRGHGYRLIDAAMVVEVLSPNGDTAINEAQARVLAPFVRNDDEGEEVRAIWEAATARGPVTAQQLREECLRRYPPQPEQVDPLVEEIATWVRRHPLPRCAADVPSGIRIGRVGRPVISINGGYYGQVAGQIPDDLNERERAYVAHFLTGAEAEVKQQFAAARNTLNWSGGDPA